MTKIKCTQCEKEFKPCNGSLRDFKHGIIRNLYCSTNCYHRARKQKAIYRYLWAFWNKWVNNDTTKAKGVNHECTHCGISLGAGGFKHHLSTKSKMWLCWECDRKIRNRILEQARTQYQKDALNYNFRLLECDRGVCDVLAMHHDKMAEDPERLTSDFLIGLICGMDKQEKYSMKKAWAAYERLLTYSNR
jgi:hypothetical protein